MIEINIELSDENVEIETGDDEVIELDVENHTENIVEVGGTSNYEELDNKPAIDAVELWKHTKLEDIGIETATNTDINDLFK